VKILMDSMVVLSWENVVAILLASKASWTGPRQPLTDPSITPETK